MLSKIESCGLNGLTGLSVCVEADVSGGIPTYELVGLPDAAVKEARERVKSAVKNSGLPYPGGRIIINLAPADLKKEGSNYDLPIAAALLCAQNVIPPESLKDTALIGELALDGSLRAVKGVLPMAIDMYERGIKFLPIDLYKSSSTKFIVEEDGIRPPLNSIAGLGTVAALGIEKARQDGKFMSIDDMKIRSKVGDSVAELLKKLGCLKGMSQSNQLSLFG